MGVESAADRLAFLSVDDFGVSATYQPARGANVALIGIFDNEHLMVEAGEAGVSSLAPVFTCRTSDLEALPSGDAIAGDTMTIADVGYTVSDVRPDGTGMTMLILEKR